MDSVYWKEFRISDIFEIKKVYGKPFKEYKNGNIPYVTGTVQENGIVGYVDTPVEAVSKGNCISVDPITGKACYQPVDFVGRGFSGASINLLYHENLNDCNALYICSVIRKVSFGIASYTNLFNGVRLGSVKICLPAKKDGTPDWDYMAERIKELEAERIKELEAYLIASGLDDFKLTKEDKEVLENFGNVRWKELLLKDIAKLEYGNKFDKNKMTYCNPMVNFVSRTASNNGVSDYVDEIKDKKPYPAGLITLAFGGSIGSCFLQSKPFYTGQNVGVINLGNISNRAKLFVAKAISKKCKSSYVAFGDEINKHFKVDLSISIPVKEDGQPDWDYMERYIRATEKLVIADAVKWKDQQIATTKQIVDKSIA